MAQSTAYAGAQRPSDGGWAARPRYTLADILTLLWRDRWLMLSVFALLFVLGAGAALTLKKTYTTGATLLVRLGQEYVYEPELGDAARGAVSTTDTIVQSEVTILSSPGLKERVIRGLGLDVVAPKLAKAYSEAQDERARQAIMSKAVAAMDAKLTIGSIPQSSVIRLNYSDESPAVAARVLNRVLDEYLIYRRGVLDGGSSDHLRQQREAFAGQLAELDGQYEAFLAENAIGDFTADRAALNTLQASLVDERFRVAARLSEVEGRLGEIGRQAASAAPQIEMFRDTDPSTQAKLNQLLVERQELLSRYKPTSQPVRDKDAQIAEVRALAEKGQGEGARRIGVNPIYQTVQTERIQLSAEAASLRERAAALAAQLDQVAERRRLFNELEPRWTALNRDRDVLQANIRALVEREQQGQAASAIARKSNDNIRVVQRPSIPVTGKSLKKLAFVGAFLFAALTALCLGLLRVFLRQGYPTARSAARTIELPVLATAKLKPA
jgi:uncharacterized protein involved in exopolysaccharide biosynthesis